MEDSKSYTPLNNIGEFNLIERLTKNFPIQNSTTVKGVGDDAAIIDAGEKYMVVTTDMLVEGIHFNLIYTPLKHLGYKAVIVNLSDVYAMNAIPTQITVSIAVSSKFYVEHLEELYEGIKLACERYGVDLVGGDTTSSLTGLAISITAIGWVNKDKVVLRNGAKENDLICVSGDLGGAYMGLQLLERERRLFEKEGVSQPDFGSSSYVLERQLKPEARKDIINIFEESNIKPTAMIDISDGLSSEILHICKSSNMGCIIYQEKIPVSAETEKVAEEFQIHPITAALNGGEDYELLFTIPLSQYDLIVSLPQIRIIGYITQPSKGCRLLLDSEEEIDITAQGWKAL
jgi:thiamine-monophosphate kinase